MLARNKRGPVTRSAPSDRLRCRFDICDVDRLGGLVQGSRNLYLLPGECLELFLVVQLIESLVCLEENKLTAPLHAGERALLRVVSTHLLEHRLVPPTLGTRTVHDLAAEGHILRPRETRRQQHTCRH